MRHTRKNTLNRNSYQIVNLRRRHGLEGYAVYVMLREIIEESAGKAIPADFDTLAYSLHADAELVAAVASDAALFSTDPATSALRLADAPPSVSPELSRKRSEAGRKGMRSRWAARQNAATDTTEQQPDSTAAGGSTDTTEQQPDNTAANDNTAVTNGAEKKEKENLPLHPLKEKQKENNNREDSSAVVVEAEQTESTPTARQDDVKSTDVAELTDRHLQNFMNYWNAMLRHCNSNLRPLSIISQRRRQLLNQMRRRFSDAQIAAFVRNAARSPYLNARDGRLSAPADINWMLATEDRIVKIIEGNL